MSIAITSEEFSKILKEKKFIYEKNPHIAVGVSGGADSIALLVLVNRWIKIKKGLLTAVHFNHKMRKDSNLDADFVKNLSLKLGIECKILNWNGPKPNSSLMEKARNQRYEKILNYCKSNKIITLMTAHHLEDSIETYLMRKSRKHSSLGLAGIPTFNNRSFIQIFRPLLDIKKERLVKTCLKHKFNWIEDPSNKNKKFERVRVREKIKKLSEIKKKKIVDDLRISLKNNMETEERLGNFFCENLDFNDLGIFTINKDKLLKFPKKFKIEVLKKILVTCSGSTYPPRVKKIEFFLEKLKLNLAFKISLHSCIIKLNKNIIHIYREYNKITKTTPECIGVKKNKSLIWDKRFEIFASKSDLNCYIMKENIWIKLKKKYEKIKNVKRISFETLKTLPVIQVQNTLHIPFMSPEKNLNDLFEIKFRPQIPITKKNF